MAINSKDLLGGGAFVTRFYSATVSVASGASGTLFTLTPPAGQMVKLDSIVADSTTQDDITITVGGVDVVSGKVLSGSDVEQDGHFTINAGKSSFGQVMGQSIIGGVDEVLVVAKGGSPTTNTIRYMYQFGEIA